MRDLHLLEVQGDGLAGGFADLFLEHFVLVDVLGHVVLDDQVLSCLQGHNQTVVHDGFDEAHSRLRMEPKFGFL
ncbi:hypothetical protein D3C81_1704150 [compost metagenome]